MALRPQSGEDTFLERICVALNETPRMLAKNCGVPFDELEPLLDKRHLLAEIDRDPVWWKIDEYLSKRLGLIIAAKYEMNKALQRDRKKRIVRKARLEAFHDK